MLRISKWNRISDKNKSKGSVDLINGVSVGSALVDVPSHKVFECFKADVTLRSLVNNVLGPVVPDGTGPKLELVSTSQTYEATILLSQKIRG